MDSLKLVGHAARGDQLDHIVAFQTEGVLLERSDAFAKALGVCARLARRHSFESARACESSSAADTALLLQTAMAQRDRDGERQLCVVAACGGNTVMVKTFMTTRSQIGSGQVDLRGDRALRFLC